MGVHNTLVVCTWCQRACYTIGLLYHKPNTFRAHKSEVIMKFKSSFLSLVGIAAVLTAVSASGFAQASHQHENHQGATSGAVKFLGKGDGVTTCAVTGEDLADKSIKGEFFGRTVYFCCGGCLAKAKEHPELYVKPTAEEQAKATKSDSKFLGKGDGIETCPVTGEPVNKTLKAQANGQTFYVCCEGCIETVQKNPELYLKPAKKEHANHGPAGAGGFLGKGDGVTTCPVTGEPISKDVKAEIDGRTVYACCAGCLTTVKNNPSLYLKKQ